MAVWRVILKKTNYLGKGKVVAHSGNALKRYLARYVDEVGKASQKRGEAWQKDFGGEEERWLLPEESTGVIYSGGFIGESKSPGKVESNKQLGWCRRIVDRWVLELKPRTKRRNDGFRFILSLGQKAVADLTASGISTDQAMREIWRSTMELYRVRHGWDNPEGELAWLCGAHHDTDNAHLHIILFPTTKGGSPLKTNYRGIGKNREDHLMEMIGMANIAAEMFWREHLDLKYQSREYIEQVSSNPAEEPPLPKISDFGSKAVVEKKGESPSIKPRINTALVAKNTVDDIRLLFGEERPQSKRKGKGIRRLKAILAGNQAYGENRKKKFWEVFRGISRKLGETIAALEEEFPEESKALGSLVGSLGKRKVERKLARGLSKRGVEWAWGILDLVLGGPEDPSDQHTLEEGCELAGMMDAAAKAIPDNKLKTAWDAATEMGREARKARIREQVYRQVGRLAKPGSVAKALLKQLIRGANRLSHILEARREETRRAIKKTRKGFSKRVEKRTWMVREKKMVREDNMGPPWPDHFDAATVFEPLAAGKAPKEKVVERKPISLKAEREPDEGILSRLARVAGLRRKSRNHLAKLLVSQPEQPDIS